MIYEKLPNDKKKSPNGKKRIDKERRKRIVSNIAVRLDNLKDVTKRSRLAFLVTTIASCAILITIWSVYFSTARDVALYFSINKEISEGIDRKVDELYASETEKKNAFKQQVKKQTEFYIPFSIEINEEIDRRADELYASKTEKKKNAFKEQVKKQIEFYIPVSLKAYAELDRRVDKLYPPEEEDIKREKEKNEFKQQAKNYIKKQRNEEMLLFDGSSEKPYIPILQLHEYNRRELAREWIKNLNVSIDLLGIEININDFPFIGSLSLCVVGFWLFFAFRRENRAIVSLLRDVKNELDFSAENTKRGGKVWDIANYTFHGVANSLIFFTTGTNDNPLSNVDIFGGAPSKFQQYLDSFIGQLTKLIRKLVMILIFFPALTIGVMIWADFYSTEYVRSPFRAEDGINITPGQNIKTNTRDMEWQISVENGIGIVAGFLTLFICIGCFTFQARTSKSLKEFERALKGERNTRALIAQSKTDT